MKRGRPKRKNSNFQRQAVSFRDVQCCYVTLDNQSQLVAEWNGRNFSTVISRTETRSFGQHSCSQLHRNYDLSTLPETNSGIHTWNTGVGSDDPFLLVLFVLFSAAFFMLVSGARFWTTFFLWWSHRYRVMAGSRRFWSSIFSSDPLIIGIAEYL